jgi:hypothetical protein
MVGGASGNAVQGFRRAAGIDRAGLYRDLASLHHKLSASMADEAPFIGADHVPRVLLLTPDGVLPRGFVGVTISLQVG